MTTEGQGRGYGFALATVLIAAGTVAVGLQNFLLFHILVELLTVVVGFSVFVLAWNSRSRLDSDFLTFLGLTYLVVAFLDLLHALSYKGMGVFPGADANLPTQLWIAARYVESMALALSPWMLRRRSQGVVMFAGVLAVLTLMLASIFYWDIFPDCYLEPGGLTPFKVGSEYVICGILGLAVVRYVRLRDTFHPQIHRLLVASLVLTIGAELLFTFYVSVYGISNLAGHVLKAVSFLLIYEVVIASGIRKPFEFLYRNLQEEKQVLGREMESRLRAEQDMERANVLLARKNAELEEFAQVVSHDLKTPMVAIAGFAMLIRRRLDSAPREKLLEYLDAVGQAVERMQELVGSILALARVGDCLGTLERLRIREKLAEIREDLRAYLEEHGAEIVVCEPLHEAYGDRVRVRQVFQNLIVNAVENRGAAAPRIEIRSSREDGFIAYRVEDNGRGIPEGERAGIFDVYRTLRPDGSGSGLGLAIVRKVVEAHGGQVEVAVAGPAGGSVFRFTLPDGLAAG